MVSCGGRKHGRHAGAALAKVAATFVLDNGSSQHAQNVQHVDGVAECPWGELQAVAIEMVKLMVATLHEVYSECYAWDPCTGDASAQLGKHRTATKQRPQNPSRHTASCSDRQLTSDRFASSKKSGWVRL